MRNHYNSLIGILFVARKYTNESFLSESIDNLPHDNNKIYEFTKVKIPYFYIVSVRGTIRLTINGKAETHPTTTDFEPIKKPFPKEWDIAEYKPIEIRFLNKCPKCHKEGRPRINKKNNEDFTHYKKPNLREEEYRLAYWHKVEGKKDKPCIIARFDQESGIFTETGEVSDKVIDYVFPNYIIKNT